ncbi:hypothetical protein BBJ29_007401 [Phytophthora kernoviae]|uniref:PLAC8 family protein n=1 Tax=Phytophthora kernoviae TaxID=325452 RepID=A0A3F2REN8_9STRA|nr:hypothetical protein BBJ29_007401 [Phytophthora kernoviae]RLN53705.1 hypothetical protein BBP00_00009222 [Phytophthora kernoviae]
MADKKTQLPLPTPATEPGFVGESPSSGEFVTILTPENVNKTLTPNVEDAEFDPNGLRMQIWSTGLHDSDLRTAYYWWVCCCPCVPLSQLETRLGLNSCGIGFMLNLVAYLGRALFLVLALLNLFKGKFGTFGVFLVIFAICALWVASRVARVRIQIRERLDIAGSAKDDRYLGCYGGANAIRQMAVQLKCNQVHFALLQQLCYNAKFCAYIRPSSVLAAILTIMRFVAVFVTACSLLMTRKVPLRAIGVAGRSLLLPQNPLQTVKNKTSCD